MSEQVISILMPVFNAEKYVSACIKSILNQSYQNWELVAVDDFSTDRSLEILYQFSKEESRIKVFTNQIKGIIPALNLALKFSSGEFISRMDADDMMPENKLKTLHDIVVRDRKNVATGFVHYFSSVPVSEGYKRYEIWLNEVAQENLFEKKMYRECVIASPNWLVHRSCFDSLIDMSELCYPEDYDLVLKWYRAGFNFVSAKTVTHFWREHAQRTSRNSEIYQQQSFFKLKTKFFIDNELNSNEKIQLIGAGIKGKLVAEILENYAVKFDWYEFNKAAHQREYLDVKNIQSNFKTILTNWPIDKANQEAIIDFLKKKNFVEGKNIWLF